MSHTAENPAASSSDAIAPELLTWRPIESAPKDGTSVVVYSPKTPGGKARRNRVSCPATVAHYEAGWKWLTTPGDYQVSPTHWMPLPDGPKGHDETAEDAPGTNPQ